MIERIKRLILSIVSRIKGSKTAVRPEGRRKYRSKKKARFIGNRLIEMPDKKTAKVLLVIRSSTTNKIMAYVVNIEGSDKKFEFLSIDDISTI